jgi:hypothetical protein
VPKEVTGRQPTDLFRGSFWYVFSRAAPIGMQDVMTTQEKQKSHFPKERTQRKTASKENRFLVFLRWHDPVQVLGSDLSLPIHEVNRDGAPLTEKMVAD